MNRKKTDQEAYRQWLREAHESFSTPPSAFGTAWGAAQRRVKAPRMMGWLRPAFGAAFLFALVISAVSMRTPTPKASPLTALRDLAVPSDALLDEQTASLSFRFLPLGEDDSDDYSLTEEI